MEALKLIPQAFFEFFARLVPGAVALAIWMALFDGVHEWPVILQAVAAGRLDKANALVFATLVAVFIAYTLGQLVAPLGKAVQRISEFLAVPVAWALIKPRNWARDVVGKNPETLAGRRRRWLRQRHVFLWPPSGNGWVLIAVRLVDFAPAPREKDKNSYDYLRANAPEVGALVAKIRSEYTMFNALTAIFAIAAIAYAGSRAAASWRISTLLVVAAIVCACRGYFVEKRMGQSAKKLRSAFDEFRLSEPVARRRTDTPAPRPTIRNGAKKQLMSDLAGKGH